MRPRDTEPGSAPGALERIGKGSGRIGQVVCFLLVLSFLVVLLRTAWVSDDAFITLRTVDNLVHGHGLRWNVDERVQSFTHPLWLFVLALAYSLTGEAYFTIVALSIVVSLAAAVLFAWGFRHDPPAAAVGLTVWILSKAFVDYSTSGLENPLTHLLLIVFLLLLPEHRPAPRRLLALGLVAGLGALNRPDTILLFVPGLVFALARHGRWRGSWLMGAGLAPLLAWEVFSIVYYGLPYPNTALAKLNTGIGAGPMVAQGLHYLANSLRNDPLTLTVSLAALVAAGVRGRWRGRSVALGIVLYLAYVVRIGGDFMSGRFLSPVLVVAVVLLLQVGVFRVAWMKPAFACGVLLLGFLAPFPPPLSGADYGLKVAGRFDAHGIADERRFYFGEVGLLNGAADWRRPSPLATKKGRGLKRAGARMAAEGAVGLLGYEAGPGVHIVDYHALGDPLLSRLPAVVDDPIYRAFYIEHRHRPPKTGWRIGHFLRVLPRGYLATVATGENRIEDPEIARLYDRLSRITRGPLWDWSRLEEIVRMNLGASFRVHRPSPEFEWFDWREVIAVDPHSAEPRYQLGRSLAHRGRFDEALPSLLRAIELDPLDARALNDAARSSIHLGRYEEAADFSRRARVLAPDDPDPYENTGELLRLQGRYREAIAFFRGALERNPVLAATMYSNIGLCHLNLGELAAAITWLRKSTEVDPGLAATSYNLGVALAHQGDTKESIRMFERALDQDPGIAMAALDMAAIHVRAGEAARAIETLDRFLERNPDSALVLFRLSELLEATGSHSRALDRLREAARLGFEPARRALSERGAEW